MAASFDLTGKIALVSGASRGIGAAIAKLLAEQGAHIIVSSRRQADCEAVVDDIVAAGGSAEAAEEAIRTHVKTYVDKGVISKFAIPDRVMIVKELPLTSVGKVDKAALRERHLRDEAV